jgi:2-polyprenyl-6-methoxyphenol hydroxylase-like FAD-dependent oxidoreductase
MLLARQGAETTLVERTRDFAREFRGEVLMPGGLEVIRSAGIWESFLDVPQQPIRRMRLLRGERLLADLDLVRILGADSLPRAVSQPHLLEKLVLEGAERSGVRYVGGAKVTGALREGGRVTGVAAVSGEEPLTLNSDYVLGCDGRHSTLRRDAQLEPDVLQQGFDVIWCRLPTPRELVPPDALQMWLGNGHLGIGLPSYGGAYQLGWVIRKGSWGELKGEDAWAHRLADHMGGAWGEHVRGLAETDVRTAVLDVRADRLPSWSVPGMLLVGDAAHVMSPVGGQGINIALRDAVRAASLLGPLLAGTPSPDSLDRAASRVQAERAIEVERIQRVQDRLPRTLFAERGPRRFLVDRVLPRIANKPLGRWIVSGLLHTFAHGVGEARFEPS